MQYVAGRIAESFKTDFFIIWSEDNSEKLIAKLYDTNSLWQNRFLKCDPTHTSFCLLATNGEDASNFQYLGYRQRYTLEVVLDMNFLISLSCFTFFFYLIT